MHQDNVVSVGWIWMDWDLEDWKKDTLRYRFGGLEEGYTEIQICFMHDRPAKMEDFQFDPQFNSFQGKYRTEVLSEPCAFIDPNV